MDIKNQLIDMAKKSHKAGCLQNGRSIFWLNQESMNGIEFAGVGAYLADVSKGNLNLFNSGEVL
ncbi:hypothetical protein ABEV66_16385 [Bacillus smithii]